MRNGLVLFARSRGLTLLLAVLAGCALTAPALAGRGVRPFSLPAQVDAVPLQYLLVVLIAGVLPTCLTTPHATLERSLPRRLRLPRTLIALLYTTTTVGVVLLMAHWLTAPYGRWQSAVAAASALTASALALTLTLGARYAWIAPLAWVGTGWTAGLGYRPDPAGTSHTTYAPWAFPLDPACATPTAVAALACCLLLAALTGLREPRE